jgi:hypothetical protein
MDRLMDITELASYDSEALVSVNKPLLCKSCLTLRKTSWCLKLKSNRISRLLYGYPWVTYKVKGPDPWVTCSWTR